MLHWAHVDCCNAHMAHYFFIFFDTAKLHRTKIAFFECLWGCSCRLRQVIPWSVGLLHALCAFYKRWLLLRCLVRRRYLLLPIICSQKNVSFMLVWGLQSAFTSAFVLINALIIIIAVPYQSKPIWMLLWYLTTNCSSLRIRTEVVKHETLSITVIDRFLCCTLNIRLQSTL